MSLVETVAAGFILSISIGAALKLGQANNRELASATGQGEVVEIQKVLTRELAKNFRGFLGSTVDLAESCKNPRYIDVSPTVRNYFFFASDMDKTVGLGLHMSLFRPPPATFSTYLPSGATAPQNGNEAILFNALTRCSANQTIVPETRSGGTGPWNIQDLNPNRSFFFCVNLTPEPTATPSETALLRRIQPAFVEAIYQTYVLLENAPGTGAQQLYATCQKLSDGWASDYVGRLTYVMHWTNRQSGTAIPMATNGILSVDL